MKSRTKRIAALVLVTGMAAGGAAFAQSMQGGGPHMQGCMKDGQCPMQTQMHGRSGMHHGGGHGGGHGSGHEGHHGQETRKGDQSASSLAFNAVNDKMHRDMAIEYSGDADADFVRGMIPHHQGAVDMAKIVMVFGKDPEVRKLAGDIVQSQEAEIAFMREWLKKRGR